MVQGFLYILQSERTGKYYIGASENVEERLVQHNSGRTPSTQSGRPWVLRFKKQYPSVKVAKQVEYRLKKMKSRNVIIRIIEEGILRLG